jgi:class 3 adenylate cyclase
LERRLAAILAADVAGYTALMGADEAGTLRRLTDLRREFLEPLIDAHHGRVVKLMGDGFLVEFASVVDAVACALAWQKGVADRDTGLRFRIGINLGDVIVEDGDIHGDGVNIAARLEGLAAPGGICLSGDAYRQARGKVEAAFEDLGDQSLKNVAEPVRVYRVAGAGPAEAAPASKPLALPDKPSIAVSSSSPATPPSPTRAKRSKPKTSPRTWACATSSRAACAPPATGSASPPSSWMGTPAITSGRSATTGTCPTSSPCRTRSPTPSPEPLPGACV